MTLQFKGGILSALFYFANFEVMKKLKLVVTILLIAFASLSGYFTFISLISEDVPLMEILSLFYTFFVTVHLLVFRFTLNQTHRVSKIDFFVFIAILLISTLMYFNRSYISSFWNINLMLFAFEAGRLLFRLIPDNTAMAILSRWTVLLSIGILETVLLFKMSLPVVYTVTGISIGALSLTLIMCLLLKPVSN